MLRPQFHELPKYGRLSHVAYRVQMGLYMMADGWGRLIFDREHLCHAILGYQREREVDLTAALAELEDAGLALPYAVNAGQYLWLPEFRIHHRTHQDEKESKLPGHPAEGLAPATLSSTKVAPGTNKSEQVPRATYKGEQVRPVQALGQALGHIQDQALGETGSTGHVQSDDHSNTNGRGDGRKPAALAAFEVAGCEPISVTSDSQASTQEERLRAERQEADERRRKLDGMTKEEASVFLLSELQKRSSGDAPGAGSKAEALR